MMAGAEPCEKLEGAPPEPPNVDHICPGLGTLAGADPCEKLDGAPPEPPNVDHICPGLGTLAGAAVPCWPPASNC